MADSKQLRVLKKLTAHLEGTSGYSDLRVIRGLTVITAKFAADNETVISILEAPRPIVGSPADEEGTIRDEIWTLLLQGFPVDDKDNPSDPAYALKAAVEARLAEIVILPTNGALRKDPLYRLGGDIMSMTIGQGVVRPPENGSSRLAMFYLPLIIRMKTNVADPWG